MRTPKPLPTPLAAAPFTVHEALAAGTSEARLRAPDLLAPFRGVRAHTLDGVHDHAAALATVMAPHHVFGGITAARLWGLPIAAAWTAAEPLVLARPAGTTRGFTKGTRQIAFDAARLDIAQHRGLRLLEPLATALTLARNMQHEALVQVVDALLTPSVLYPGLELPRRAEQPWATPEQVAAFLDRCAGLAGVRALRAAAEDARPGVDSRFETITRVLIVEAGLPEPLVHPLLVIDGIEMHPDLAYPEWKIAIEYEGDGHRDKHRWHIDIDRYARMEAAGWISVRVTKDHMARRGAGFVERVRGAIVRRA